MSYFGALIDKISVNPWVAKILSFIYTFDSGDVWIIIIVAAILFAFLVYRLWGAALMWVLLFVYLISYVLYSADVFGYYNDNNKANDKHMDDIQKEIERVE